MQYVMSCGALIQRIPWPRGFTYDGIGKLYADYVTHRYGRAVIVFDGYRDEASVKDVTHKRRTGARIGAALTVTWSSDLRKMNSFQIRSTSNVLSILWQKSWKGRDA